MNLDISKLAQTLEALAEPARLRLVALCQHGELTVKELTAATDMSQPRVSRHLRILVEADVLRRFRESHWVYYRLRFDGPAAELAQAALARLSGSDRKLQADARRLDTVLAARARELRAASGGDTDAMLAPAAWTELETAIKALAERAKGVDGLGDLLDIGTGSGRMLHALARDAQRAIGVDRSHDMRLAARKSLREAGLSNCSIREADIYGLPYDDGRFDTVVFGHVLTCAKEPWNAVAEAVRVLKPGGHLLVMELLPEGMPVEAWSQSLADWLAGAGAETLAHEHLALPGVTAVLMLNERAPPAEDEPGLAESA